MFSKSLLKLFELISFEDVEVEQEKFRLTKNGSNRRCSRPMLRSEQPPAISSSPQRGIQDILVNKSEFQKKRHF